MATVYKIHPETPQTRKISAIRDALQQGAVMLYPTDTVYAIGCDLNVKGAVQRVRQLKQLANEKPLTFLCSSLSNIADYAVVDDNAYRIIKRLIPGSYTFLLPATKEVPRLVMSPKRRTTGIRVPDHAICQALLEELGHPIISTSSLSVAQPSGQPDLATLSKALLFDRLENQVDIIIDDSEDLTYEVSSILDFTEGEPTLIRRGLGWEKALSWVPERV
ncbi:L-threonylcarbamoyladenylate synthase [Pseudanabaena sp. FACHB-2040]|uniref:L-threonylcarbamoyladenylate synthase n=1 Tax=Pseudanabaena sp. FACHB-2040 TaxID=2692859 RepID=UPI0016872E1E|nr:L-threonylcarbamoyladenylate synthase [Pseudanabaena sp. FACHB-2040]MBD0269153.1 threonylcarbamoyl-AMP synthase [Cyanobacteria bacterium Co-bin8]MBD2258508.1 threonylcarbamoyl-AMP synthase [Pseudanabaena sp. FACHB-2040]